MKSILLVLCALLCWSCTDTDRLVNAIANDRIMESEYIGFGGSKSKQYKRFQKLKSTASLYELEHLIKHESPIIRSYAYLALIERGHMSPSTAFEDAIQNNQSFSQITFDQILGSDICTEIYYNTLNNSRNPENSINMPFLRSEIIKMDSLIIYGLEANHLLQFLVLTEKILDESYNDRIKELALDFNDFSAIFYIYDNGIEVEPSKFKEAIKKTLQNKIGSDPKRTLKKILEELD
ncbi:MAG: hypothetical protein AAF502_16910 [Bacteroidota bacterium]